MAMIKLAVCRYSLMAIGALVLGGCASTSPIAPAVTPAMASSSGFSQDLLNQGRQIFAGPCTACHRADPISMYSKQQWKSIVADMAPRTKLDAQREAALLAYIMASASH